MISCVQIICQFEVATSFANAIIVEIFIQLWSEVLLALVRFLEQIRVATEVSVDLGVVLVQLEILAFGEWNDVLVEHSRDCTSCTMELLTGFLIQALSIAFVLGPLEITKC